MTDGSGASDLRVEPLTRARWADLEDLFGPRGAVAGCWCMWWRQSAREFAAEHGERNRRSLRRIVDGERVPGLLAYRDGRPVGWVSISPRDEFGRLNRSRVLGPVDGVPVWSIVCFYIRPRDRRGGVGRALVDAAVAHAREAGAAAVEAYPVDADRKTGSGEVFTGVPGMFRHAGFREIERRSPTRPVLRLDLA